MSYHCNNLQGGPWQQIELQHIWLTRKFKLCHVSLASVLHVSESVIAPVDAVKVGVNELLSHVGWCLWGSSQDSLHVLSLFAVWRLWCGAWLQRVACGQTGGDQLSTGSPRCGPTLSPTEQRLRSVCVCFCGIPRHACFYMQEAVNKSNVHM